MTEAQERLRHAPAPVRRGFAARVAPAHLVMAAAGLAAFVVSYAFLRQQDSGVLVAAAARPIEAGQTVGASSFRFVKVNVPDEVLATLVARPAAGEFEGWKATASIAPGQLISRSVLQEAPGAPDAGLVEINLRMEPEDAPPSLRPGDLIDVIATPRGAAPVFLAMGVRVVDLPGSGEGGRASGLGLSSKFYLTLVLDRHTAATVASAAANGKVAVVRSTAADPGEVVTGLVPPPGAAEPRGPQAAVHDEPQAPDPQAGAGVGAP